MTTRWRYEKPNEGISNEGIASGQDERSLIQERLVVPHRASTELRRERLLALLDIRADKPITLVSAPAGSGKTTLLSAWSEDQLTRRPGAGVPVAWVTCDPRESDPPSFWGYVNSALESAGSGATRSERHNPTRSDVGSTLRRLESFGMPMALVLDDVHAISDRDTQDQLGYLIEALPTGAHLVVSTRVDPTLTLFKKRAAGLVQEIRIRDLSFTRREVDELVKMSGIDLSTADSSLLWEYTEGWAAGIKLAIMSMRHAADPAMVVKELIANPESAISGYLMEQALTHLPPDIRSFLLETSIVERLDPELAELLTGRSDSGQVLRSLGDEPGFVFPAGMDGMSFRYHGLFRALLMSELHLADRQHMLALHLRVATWARSTGNAELAVEHALAGHDFNLATDSMLDLAVSKVPQGHAERLGQLLSEFPADVARTDSRLQVIRATMELLGADPSQAIRRIGAIRDDLARWPGNAGVRIRAIADLAEACAHHRTGDDDGALRIAQASRLNAELEPADPDPGWDATLQILWATVETSALFWAGRLDDAEQAALLAAQLAREAGPTPLSGLAQEIVAMCQVRRGDLNGADRTIRSAANAGPTPGRGILRFKVRALALAWIELERHRLEQADDALQPAEEALRSSPRSRVAPAIAIARVRLELIKTSDAQSALDSLDEIRRRYSKLEDNWLNVRAFRSTRIEAMLGLSRFEEALDLASQSQPDAASDGTPPSRLMRAVTSARILIKGADHPESDFADLDLPALEEEVMETVATLEGNGSAPQHEEAARVRLLLSAAVLEHQQSHDHRGSWLLGLALEKVNEQGWRSPFYELGEPAIELLEFERMRVSQYGGLVTELLAELRTSFALRRTLLVAPLSEREMEILQFLPTALSQAELCSTLYISKNTLKSHLRAIYRKLNVENRREAVMQAQQLQLL